mmetsp:Transcript_19445/g.60877  ORF Transcript_19445/g.60877 Transcript_19445/m.60877 type:complete len:171 (-) Transcript_19445:89-601(-)
MDSRRAGGGNRLMTSTTLNTNDMWSKTIGFDPHASADDIAAAAETRDEDERKAQRAKGVMELARLDAIKQGGGNRADNFAQSLFWGLKRKAAPKGYEMAPLDSSSGSSSDSSDSEDEERAAKRRKAEEDIQRRKAEKKAAKKAAKREKKEKKKSKKQKKDSKKKSKRSKD